MESLFIPYQQALDIKKLGFDEPCFGYYKNESETKVELYISEPHNEHYNSNNTPFTICSAPLYQQAFDWFRNKHDLYSKQQFNVREDNILWEYYITRISSSYCRCSPEWYKSYRESEIGCIKKLIKIVKNEIIKKP